MRAYYLDYLRALAILMVILTHTAATYSLAEINNSSLVYWHMQNIFSSIARISVPLFLMITGALAFKKIEVNQYTMAAKRINKLLKGLFYGGTLYILYRVYFNHEIFSLSYVFKMFFSQMPYYHFWYIYMMIPLTLFFPFIQKIINEVTKKEIIYFCLVTFILGSVLPYIGVFTNGTITLNNNLLLDKLAIYIFYIIMGYYFYNFEIEKKQRMIIYLLGGISLIITIVGTFIVTQNNNGLLNQVFYEYHAPNIIMMAIASFLAIRSHKQHKCSKLIEVISKYSFSVYIIHPLIIDIFMRKNYIFSKEQMHPLIRVPMMTISVLVTSYLIMIILFKIKDILNRKLNKESRKI